VPNFNCAILRTGNDDRERGVEDSERDISGVALQTLDGRFGVIVPHFDKA
jgi:hypothetical protein